MSGGRHVVICAGNRYRSDDGVGLRVAAALRRQAWPGVEVLTLEGEPTVLLDVLGGAELAILVDAVAGTGSPGSIHRFDASVAPVPANVFGSSTHAFGLGETIELARTLGRLRGRVLVYGISGADFGAGDALSPAVTAAAEQVSSEILERLREALPQPTAAKGEPCTNTP